jgi:hypothetical protein
VCSLDTFIIIELLELLLCTFLFNSIVLLLPGKGVHYEHFHGLFPKRLLGESRAKMDRKYYAK